MFELTFNTNPDFEHHACRAYRNGDWITFQCPTCNYERRENWRTGEFQVRNSQPHVRHSGSYFPAEYRDAFENVN